MAKHTTLTDLFTAIADAIRAQKGTTGTIVADNFPDEIAGISSGVDVSGVTATAVDVLSPKKFVNSSGELISGAINTVNQATPNISVSRDGLITAYASQSAGYVSSGTKSDTHTLSSSDDSDFIASNIKSGVSIFGLTGTYGGTNKVIQVSTSTDDIYSPVMSITFECNFDPKIIRIDARTSFMLFDDKSMILQHVFIERSPFSFVTSGTASDTVRYNAQTYKNTDQSGGDGYGTISLDYTNGTVTVTFIGDVGLAPGASYIVMALA